MPNHQPHSPERARKYLTERIERVQGHYEWTTKFRGSVPYAWDGTAWRNAVTYAWELDFGKVPADVKVIRACDNVLCINPMHMLLLPAHLAKTVRSKARNCKRGHWVVPGQMCVPCRRKTWRDSNDRRRGKPKKSRWKGRKEWRQKTAQKTVANTG